MTTNKTKKYTAWVLLNNNGTPFNCRCHPSKRLAYTIYKRKNPEFSDSFWKKITFEI